MRKYSYIFLGLLFVTSSILCNHNPSSTVTSIDKEISAIKNKNKQNQKSQMGKAQKGTLILRGV